MTQVDVVFSITPYAIIYGDYSYSIIHYIHNVLNINYALTFFVDALWNLGEVSYNDVIAFIRTNWNINFSKSTVKANHYYFNVRRTNTKIGPRTFLSLTNRVLEKLEKNVKFVACYSPRIEVNLPFLIYLFPNFEYPTTYYCEKSVYDTIIVQNTETNESRKIFEGRVNEEFVTLLKNNKDLVRTYFNEGIPLGR